MKSAPVKIWLAFAALSLVWGSGWIASNSLAEFVPPLRGSALRFIIASLVCLPVMARKRLKLPRGRALAFILLLSATMIALPFLLLLWAKQNASSSTITVLFAAMPLLVALLTPGPVPRRAIQCAIVAAGAIAFAVGASFSWGQVEGAVLATIAVCSIGASSLVARRELASVAPVVVTALLTAAAGLLLLAASLVLERGEPLQWNGEAIVSLLCLSTLAGAPAYATYFWLLQQREAYQVATLEWTQPLIAIAESAILLHQRLSLGLMVGFLVTLVCLFLLWRARLEDDQNVSLLGT